MQLTGRMLIMPMLLILLLHSTAADKKSDCTRLCNSPGSSDVGGCRCSFTLFTSKRNSYGTPNQLPWPYRYLDQPPVKFDRQERAWMMLKRLGSQRGQQEVANGVDFPDRSRPLFYQ